MGDSQRVRAGAAARGDLAGQKTFPRVVLADDHAPLLREIGLLLESDFEVVGSASDGAALLRSVAERRPDIVVTDVQMPERSGIEAAREIVERGLCDAVVVLSLYDDPQLIQSAIEAGVRGYVLKGNAGDELIPAMYAVLAGGRYVSGSVKK